MRFFSLFVVALAVSASAASAQSSRIAGWAVDRSVDPITDLVTAIAVSPESPQGRRNSVSLVVTCIGDSVEVAFAHRELRGASPNRVNVTYRFDSEPAVGPLSVQLRGDHRATLPFLNTPERAAPFVAEAAQARQVVIRVVDPPDGTTMTTTLPLTGFARVVEAMGCPQRTGLP